jgi:hypothetical protein
MSLNLTTHKFFSALYCRGKMGPEHQRLVQKSGEKFKVICTEREKGNVPQRILAWG